MLSVCKDNLEQREREIKVTRSELEESGAILVDRLVLTTELQRTNELLSAQLKQALLEKEVSAAAYKHLLAVDKAGEKAVFYAARCLLWICGRRLCPTSNPRVPPNSRPNKGC